MSDYASYTSIHGYHVLEIDRFKECLRVEMFDWNDGQRLVGEFNLAEAEEIAASIANVCRNIRKNRT